MPSYETPKKGNFGMSPWSLKSLVEEFNIQIDYCATKENRVVLAFISPEQDALGKSWVWNGWMNPEYKYQSLWVPYAVRQVREHKITVVALLQADTSVRYFQQHVMEIHPDGTPWINPSVQVERRWITGRINFYKDGKPQPKKDRPRFASIVVIWSPRN